MKEPSVGYQSAPSERPECKHLSYEFHHEVTERNRYVIVEYRYVCIDCKHIEIIEQHIFSKAEYLTSRHRKP